MEVSIKSKNGLLKMKKTTFKNTMRKLIKFQIAFTFNIRYINMIPFSMRMKIIAKLYLNWMLHYYAYKELLEERAFLKNNQVFCNSRIWQIAWQMGNCWSFWWLISWIKYYFLSLQKSSSFLFQKRENTCLLELI